MNALPVLVERTVSRTEVIAALYACDLETGSRPDDAMVRAAVVESIAAVGMPVLAARGEEIAAAWRTQARGASSAGMQPHHRDLRRRRWAASVAHFALTGPVRVVLPTEVAALEVVA